MASNLFDYIGEQSNLSGLQQWTQNGGLKADPDMSQLAQLAPRTYAEVFPQMLQKQAEGNAIQQFYGSGSQGQQTQPQQQPVPQGVPQDADTALQQMQQPPQPAQPDNSARYQAMAYLPTALQSVAAQQMMMQGIGGDSTGQIAGGTPEERMKNLQASNPMIASTVQSMLSGRADPTLLRRNPQLPVLLNLANNIDPNFDQTTWQDRSKTAKDFSPGGKVGMQLTQAQTAINHLATMVDASDKLGGASLGPVSPLANSIYNATQSQNPALIDYNRYSQLGGDDIANFIGGGKSTIEARQKQADLLSANNSPDARKEAAKVGVQSMFAKLEPVVDEYNRNFGTSKSVPDFLSPETKGSLAKLNLLPTDGSSGTQQLQSALQQAAAPSPLAHLSDDQLLQIAKQKGLVK